MRTRKPTCRTEIPCNHGCIYCQRATTAFDLYEESNIEVVCVPANMTQPLDLRVHGYAKKSRRKVKNWYSSQISKQLDEGKPLHDIDDPL